MASGYALPRDSHQHKHDDTTAQATTYADSDGLGIKGLSPSANGLRVTTLAHGDHDLTHYHHKPNDNGMPANVKSRAVWKDNDNSSSLMARLETLSARQESTTARSTVGIKERTQLSTELITAVLIVLPGYLVAAACSQSAPLPVTLSSVSDPEHIKRLQESILLAETRVSTGSGMIIGNIVVVQLVAAAALVLSAVLRAFRSGPRTPSVSGYASPRMPTNTNKVQKSHPQIEARLRGAAQLAVGISLPLLAATMLGGWRTGMILLSVCATGILKSHRSLKHNQHNHPQALLAAMSLAACTDVFGWTSHARLIDMILGYAALVVVVIVPSPYGNGVQQAATESSRVTPLSPSATAWSTAPSSISTGVVPSRDATMSLIAGLVLTFGGLTTVWTTGDVPQITSLSAGAGITCAVLTAVSLQYASISTLHSSSKVGFLAGCFSLSLTGLLSITAQTFAETIGNILLSGLHIVAVMSSMIIQSPSTVSATTEQSPHAHDSERNSAFTLLLLNNTAPDSLIHGILQEKDSRRIAYFTCLNFAFMLVQGLYGYLSGSLGLLSDTVHMFFDCLGLIVGLGAAIASRWPPSRERPFGWGKLNTLAGFGNGIFLMLVSVEFVWEAIEGILEGRELRRVKELLVVSTLGLLVNLVGLFAFGHAHAGHDHGHDHGHHHHDGHDHGHNENMHGIFLHVAADAGGSLAVIVSTALTLWNPWYLWDPLATIIIAILIFAAAVPLVASSGRKLLLIVSEETEFVIKNFLQEVGEIRGVLAYSEPRFWTIDKGASPGHDHRHDHEHAGHSCKHNDVAVDHEHSHAHDHERHHSHDHDHPHPHEHAEEHDDHHHHPTTTIVGSLHVTIMQQASLSDVYERINAAALAKGMQLTIQVEHADVSFDLPPQNST